MSVRGDWLRLYESDYSVNYRVQQTSSVLEGSR